MKTEYGARRPFQRSKGRTAGPLLTCHEVDNVMNQIDRVRSIFSFNFAKVGKDSANIPNYSPKRNKLESPYKKTQLRRISKIVFVSKISPHSFPSSKKNALQLFSFFSYAFLLNDHERGSEYLATRWQGTPESHTTYFSGREILKITIFLWIAGLKSEFREEILQFAQLIDLCVTTNW